MFDANIEGIQELFEVIRTTNMKKHHTSSFVEHYRHR